MLKTGLTIRSYDVHNNIWTLRNPRNQNEELTIKADTIPSVYVPEFNLKMHKWSDVVAQHEREHG